MWKDIRRKHRETYYHFSIHGPCPQFIRAIDNVGNQIYEIELVKELCDTRGRICTRFFIFHGVPDFANMDPRSEEFIDQYFGIMRKLAMCFDYVSVVAIDRILGWDKPTYFRGPEDEIRYPLLHNDLVDMRYGPLSMYLNHILRIRERDLRRRRGPSRKLAKQMALINEGVKKNYCYHAGQYVKLTVHPRTCGPIPSRAVLELGSRRHGMVYLNGMTFVPLEMAESILPGALTEHSNKIITVRGVGTGMALLDLISPIINRNGQECRSWYDRPRRIYAGSAYAKPKRGPLYPSIIFGKAVEDRVLTCDYLKKGLADSLNR